MEYLMSYGIPILGGTVAQTVLQDPIKNMIDNTKDIIKINNDKCDMSDYEVGYSPKHNKILNYYDIITGKENLIKEKQEQIKNDAEQIKNDAEQINKIAKDERTKITEYVNMESMALISSISFFVYTGYKIIKYIDNNI